MLYGYGFWQSFVDIIIKFIDQVKEYLWGLINSVLGSVLTTFNSLLHDILQTILIFFDSILPTVRWVLSYFGLYPWLMNIYIVIILVIIVLPLGVHAIKVGIRWWNALMP